MFEALCLLFMKPDIATNFFERFLTQSERGSATHDLASLGEQALPILETLFNGSAKNKFDIPYSKIGALGCGYVTVSLLKDIAKPLEQYVRKGIEDNHPYAIEAARYLPDIEEETAIALAYSLIQKHYEASYVLVETGKDKNSKVIDIIKEYPEAIKHLEKANAYLSKKT